MNLITIQSQIQRSITTKKELLSDIVELEKLECLAQNTVQSLKQGGKVIFAGNGGSFSDAQHLSAEFISRFMFNRAPLASVVLGANSSAMSAIGNDYGFDQIFARELEGLAKENDIFIPISTSGNSRNILESVNKAKELGLITVALTGADGGKLKLLCDCIQVPSNETAMIQECHIMIGHILCQLVEKSIFSESSQ